MGKAGEWFETGHHQLDDVGRHSPLQCCDFGTERSGNEAFVGGLTTSCVVRASVKQEPCAK